MPENKKQAIQRDPLLDDFGSLEEFWAFWDSHSTADYEDQMEDMDVDIDSHSTKVYWYLERLNTSRTLFQVLDRLNTSRTVVKF